MNAEDLRLISASVGALFVFLAIVLAMLPDEDEQEER